MVVAAGGADGAVVRWIPARVGLVGNPSDGYGGAVLGTVVPGLVATVTAESSDDVELSGAGAAEWWPSIEAWRAHVTDVGHVGEQRIISAAMWTLAEHVRSTGSVAPGRGVRLSWATDVPRSVGLAGSSALAVGVIDATAALWGLDLDRRVVASLALAAERDVLGIAAGWQDRIIQSFGRIVLVDAGSMDVVDGRRVPHVSPLSFGFRPPIELLVGWNPSDATSSDDYHGPLLARAASLAEPMATLAALARTAAKALTDGDLRMFADAVDRGWNVRQAAAPLRPDHAALVELMRSNGLTATTPGSGGAVVAICTDDGRTRDAVAALTAAGCTSLRFAMR